MQPAAVNCQGPCIIRANYAPVCGSNGKTYSNIDELRCDARNSPVTMVRNGPSLFTIIFVLTTEFSLIYSQGKDCTLELSLHPGPAVCGSDGETYKNPEYINCVQENGGTLYVAHDGPCDKDRKYFV
ncbi:serine protease inhibitor dipetalogastin-like [Condylostylus longicornis]|uniref:serine protease inhibitor dipetalogastin-like n=1 Tax=Condylostylus longicornis TaxID=2530218 RepID=UPI00244E0802|nr:serine protease inhibitor dipetalogastin-like [Condylostylus longicornis]